MLYIQTILQNAILKKKSTCKGGSCTDDKISCHQVFRDIPHKQPQCQSRVPKQLVCPRGSAEKNGFHCDTLIMIFFLDGDGGVVMMMAFL